MVTRHPLQIRGAARSGMTLLELTVVILVLLSLLTILFIGARAWKRGSDRAGCIMQIRNVQVAVRSFANLNGYTAGQDVAPRDLKTEVIGSGRFVEKDPACPAKGTYSLGGNRIPGVGHIYMKCSLDKTEDHHPPHTATGSIHKDW